jgi:hypothetical protein
MPQASKGSIGKKLAASAKAIPCALTEQKLTNKREHGLSKLSSQKL